MRRLATDEYLRTIIGRDAIIEIYDRLLGDAALPRDEMVALADSVRQQLIADIAATTDALTGDGGFPIEA